VQEGAGFFRFSTDELPERDRLSVWREVFGRTVVKMDMESIGSGPFRSEAQIYALPNLTVASVSSSPNRIARTRALAADGSDDLVLGILLSGQAVTHQGKREVSFQKSEAVLWSNAVPGGAIYNSSIDFLTIAMSRTVLTQVVANIDDVLMQLISRDNEALRLLTGYVRLLQHEFSGMSLELQAATSSHVQDLVALALGATRDATEIAKGRGVRVARLLAVQADILANLTRHDLSIGALAARHGISPRYIRALFQSEETTFTDFVLSQRLARVHRCLVDPRFAGYMISTIAFEAGFGDLSYFNHAFRRRYRGTPSDIRAAGRRPDDAAG
jgi:AraC-like DNA-binding protein